MIRVLIADDQALIRAGFGLLVDSDPALQVVAECDNGAAAVAAAAQHCPDVVLMDVRMPGMDGIAATRAICQAPQGAATKVIMLTTFDADDYVHEALRAGASGFLLKDTPPKDLLEAIHIVAAGEALLAPRVTRRLIEHFVRTPTRTTATPARLAVLTERERDVMRLVGHGLSNAEIAEELVLSPATAKTHVSRLMQKLEVRDRAQVVVLAYETGLVVSGDVSS